MLFRSQTAVFTEENGSANIENNIDHKIEEFYGAKQFDGSVIFSSLYPRASSVQLAGDFNNWQPESTPLEKIGENGTWQTKLPLAAGRYRYRLVVDGQWQQDPYNGWTETNPYGELNSILEVNS